MNSKQFFILTLIFTAACFFWWADQLYRRTEEIHVRKIQELSMEKELAEQLLQASSAMEPKTLQAELSSRFPHLDISPYDQGLRIEVNGAYLNQIHQEKRTQQHRLYLMGGIFLSLLIISFIWIYRSLNQAIRLNKQQNNFLLAVTHELKTPVAGMKLMWETIQRPIKPEQQQQLIEQGKKESIRMNELIENILMATRMSTDNLHMRKQAVNLETILNKYLDRVESFNAKEHTFKFDVPTEIWVKGDEISLKLVIYNLLENAIKYSPNESTITCLVKEKDNRWELIVMDEGPGIPDEHKRRVFEKFYRIGDETTRNAKGTGLGLYLVREIVRRHDGKVWVANNEPIGSNFHLIIPKL